MALESNLNRFNIHRTKTIHPLKMQSHRILSIDGVNITGELYLMYGKTELTLSKGTNGCLRCKNVLYKILQIDYKWNDDT